MVVKIEVILNFEQITIRTQITNPNATYLQTHRLRGVLIFLVKIPNFFCFTNQTVHVSGFSSCIGSQLVTQIWFEKKNHSGLLKIMVHK